MNDTRQMALLRHLILQLLWHDYPMASNIRRLASELRPLFKDRDRAWLNDAVGDQLTVLRQANLIRTAAGGFTLTERGRADRQQAARFLSKNPPPPDAA